MPDQNQKLQRLLAQQRAIAAQIKSIEDRERDRQERAIALIIRRHKLTGFDPEKLDLVLTRVVAELQRADLPAQSQAPGVAYGE